MNNKRIVRKIALSALMVSAIASPVVANAAATPTAPTTVKATAVPMAAAWKLPNPLEVAKQYVPDTVAAWESLLARHDSLADKLTPSSVSLKPGVAIANLNATPIKAEVLQVGGPNRAARPVALAGTTAFLSSSSFTLDSKSLQTGRAILGEGEAALGTLRSGDAVTIRAVSSSPSGELAVSETNETLAKALAVDGLAPGQIELGRAVKTKDENAIRDALAKLFDLYEDRLEHLQAEK